jgi:cell shape-determining protein MreD
MLNPLHTFFVLFAAFSAIFMQTTANSLRSVVGAQVDLLPSLMVYASLSAGMPTVAALSIVGGLLLDSQSANPLGISILPLFAIGFLIQKYRGLILREQRVAQLVLGFSASAFAPLVTFLLLLNTDKQPLVSWFSLWQWLLMTGLGGLACPLWFWIFDKLNLALSYKALNETSFRSDRQIKRGRS